MIKLRHTLLISILFHGAFFALLSPLVLSLGEAGKKMTEQIIVELVEGVNKKISDPAPIPVKSMAEKANKLLKPAVMPEMQKKVQPVAKLKEAVTESVVEHVAEKEIMEESIPPVNSPAEEENDVSVDYGSQTHIYPEESKIESSPAESSEAENEESSFTSSADYSLILEKIEAAKWYPRVARKRGIEGVAIVKFRISPDGNVREIMIDEPSGFSILDNAAIKTIQRAAPFPFFDSLLKVAVAFKLT